MSTVHHPSIEERLENIERGILEIKGILKAIATPKTTEVISTTDEVMTVKELTKFAKVEAQVIYSACAKREIKFMKIGKHYKFRKEDVLVWMGAHQSQNSLDVDEYVKKYLQKHKMKG